MLILRALNPGELHGLAIARRIEQITRGAFEVKAGSLFPALYRMEHAGWLTSSWGESDTRRRARYYQLTAKGRRQLETETAEWRKVVAALGHALRENAMTERRMNEELDAYVALLTEEHIARGMTPEAARRAALIEAGGVEQIKESIRDVSPRTFFDRLRQDVSYGLRLMRRAPALNLAIVLTLALGIGATSATFSVVDAVLLQPLDYHDADALVVVMHRRNNPVAPANYLDWQRHASGFASMGAAEYWTPTLGRDPDPEKLFALRVSDEMLPMLGVPPAIGRVRSARRRRRA